MGTHPIFESDFDCLTENRNVMLLTLILAIAAPISAKLSAKQRKATLEELTSGGTKRAVIGATQFKELVSDGLDSKTDYALVIEYTALPERFGCKICEEFHLDMGYIAQAAVTSSDAKKIYILSLDFGGIQMQRAFQTMGIQNVPAVVIVNGKGGVPKDDMKLLTNQIRKEQSFIKQVTSFVTAKLPTAKFNEVRKPINFTPIIIGGFFGVTIFGALYALRNIIFNRIPAAILIIGFCLITTSGYTFCQIRGSPMKGRDGSLFANGGRMMYLSEAYILMMSEAACALGIVIMNGKGALINTVGLALAFVAYVVLLAAFHVKTPHYPYYIADLF